MFSHLGGTVGLVCVLQGQGPFSPKQTAQLVIDDVVTQCVSRSDASDVLAPLVHAGGCGRRAQHVQLERRAINKIHANPLRVAPAENLAWSTRSAPLFMVAAVHVGIRCCSRSVTKSEGGWTNTETILELVRIIESSMEPMRHGSLTAFAPTRFSENRRPTLRCGHPLLILCYVETNTTSICQPLDIAFRTIYKASVSRQWRRATARRVLETHSAVGTKVSRLDLETQLLDHLDVALQETHTEARVESMWSICWETTRRTGRRPLTTRASCSAQAGAAPVCETACSQPLYFRASAADEMASGSSGVAPSARGPRAWPRFKVLGLKDDVEGSKRKTEECIRMQSLRGVPRPLVLGEIIRRNEQ